MGRCLLAHIPNKKRVFVSLGSGTSFDVRTICSTYNIDYNKLTTNNFVIMSMDSQATKVAGVSDWGNVMGLYMNGTFTKTYSAGTLTIKFAYRSYCLYGDTTKASLSMYSTPTVYLLYGFD